MMPATGLRRISVVSKRCFRNSGSCCSPNMGALTGDRRDFHAVEAEVVLAALVARIGAHVIEIRLHVAAVHAGAVGHDEGAPDKPRPTPRTQSRGAFSFAVR